MKKDWKEVELGELCDFIGGGTPSKKEPKFWNGDIPWASIKDIKGEILKTTQDFISQEGLNNSSANLALPGEIVLGTRINPGRPIISKIKTAINQDLKVVKCKIPINSKFLYYSFRNLEKEVIKNSSGTTVLGISLNNLKSIVTSLPPFPIQRALVTKIENLFASLDKGIADLEKAREQLKIYRQAVLKKAFEGELTKIWRLKQNDLPTAKDLKEAIGKGRDNYYKQQIEKWKNELKIWEYGNNKSKKTKKPGKLTIPDPPNEIHSSRKWGIPREWIWTQIGSICFATKLAGFEYTDYVKYDPNGDLLVIKAENAGPNGFKKTSFSKIKSETVKTLSRSEIFGGELLIVFVGAGTGNVARVPENGNYFLGPNIAMARPYFKINTGFFELLLQSAMGKHLMMATAKAVAQPSLSMSTIRQTPIVFPSIEEQNKILNEIESRLSVCDKIEQSINEGLEKSKALRQSILKKAFEGELLTEAEIDKCKQESDYEPASILLERIKKDKKK